jgi:hypothetical protein
VAAVNCASAAVLAATLAGCSTAPVTALGAVAEPERWDFTDPDAFRWLGAAQADGPCLDLFAAAAYRPPHRSPLAIALLRGPSFGDLDLRVSARQTGREYAHRDLVLVFAWRDAAHFAYAHLASQADANAHHVMLVDGADRRPATVERSAGVTWGDGWHELQLVRRGRRVEVAFDGRVVLVADVPLGAGRVGLGSFDDTGRFRDLRLERH